jgi:hypothetical protein
MVEAMSESAASLPAEASSSTPTAASRRSSPRQPMIADPPERFVTPATATHPQLLARAATEACHGQIPSAPPTAG